MYYKIESYNVTIDGKEKTKYKVTYIGGEFDGLAEFYAEDLNEPKGFIRAGYVEQPNITARIAKAISEPTIEKSVIVEGKEYKLVEKKLSLWQRFLSIFK